MNVQDKGDGEQNSWKKLGLFQVIIVSILLELYIRVFKW